MSTARLQDVVDMQIEAWVQPRCMDDSTCLGAAAERADLSAPRAAVENKGVHFCKLLILSAAAAAARRAAMDVDCADAVKWMRH